MIRRKNPTPVWMQVVETMHAAHEREETCSLDTLTEALERSRAAVRAALSHAYGAGFVDLVRMRLTFAGLAVAVAMRAERRSRLAQGRSAA